MELMVLLVLPACLGRRSAVPDIKSHDVIITSFCFCGQGEIGMKGDLGFDGLPGEMGPAGKNVIFYVPVYNPHSSNSKG